MYSIGGDATPTDCLYVSHQGGQDTPQCGSRTEPCQTLPQALLLVRDGGKICLDGRNSERHPYSCLFRNNVYIDKSVAIYGLFTKAHITCDPRYGNLKFTYPENRLFKLTLSNLVFHSYGVDLLNVTGFNVSISSCKFIKSSIAVRVLQKESRILSESSIVVTDSEFLFNGMSIYAILYKGLFILRISRCVFLGRKGRFNGPSGNKVSKAAIYIKYKGYPTNMVSTDCLISDCLFQDLGHEDNRFALSFRSPGIYGIGNLSVFNSTFLRNENSMFVAGGFSVHLCQVTINSTYGYALFGAGPAKIKDTVPDLKLFLDHCILANNRIGIRMTTASSLCPPHYSGACPPSNKILFVKHSLFVGGSETRRVGDAIRLLVDAIFSVRRPNDLECKVTLENVTFQEFHNSVLYVEMQENVTGFINVTNCKFVNNSYFDYHLDETPTVNIIFNEEDPPKCLNKPHNSKFLWHNKTQFPVIFENSIFENNVAITGALNLFNVNATFKNCTFKDNAGSSPGGHIYMKIGYGSLNVINSNFLQSRLKPHSNVEPWRISNDGCFLYSESVGPVIIRNSSFSANINKKFHPILAVTKSSLLEVDATSTIKCPYARWLKMDLNQITKRFTFTKGGETCRIEVTYVKIFCEECPSGFYSLQRGFISGLDKKKETKCDKCPYGALCANGTIKAKENFWGLGNSSSSPSSLKFFHCPTEYCGRSSHSTHSDNNSYNSCHGKRDGVLCGKCTDGYSEALYSTSCRKNDKCNNNWFWLATGIYVVVFAVYIVFKPPIFSKLLKHSLWFMNKPVRSDQQRTCEEDKEHDSGYLKIIFYFHQVVELVMIKSPEKTFHLVPIIPPIIAIFNFQVKSLDGSIGCPFPGLTAVTKELFKCMKFLGTLLSIGLIYAIHRAGSRSLHTAPPSMKLYLAVALETLLLGYERLADTSLNLMHCVPVEEDWRLFVDAHIACWQWWQFLLIAFIMSFIIPLVLVLFWGSLKLSKDKVTAKEFLIACAFPLPCLLIWFFRKYRKKDDRQMLNSEKVHNAEEIKQVLHGPFRAGSSEDHGTLYWESVLTGRRLILLVIHTFATDPTIRFVCLSCACVIILVHHLTVRPFCERKANICEGFSLLSLVVICMFSLTEATLISQGIDPSGPSKDLFYALQWIEIGLLSLAPLALCLLVAFCALSQVARLLYHCITYLSSVITRKCCIQESLIPRPLVVDWDSEDFVVIA